MNEKKYLRLLGTLFLVVTILLLSILSACASPPPPTAPSPSPAPAPAPAPKAEPIVWKAVTFVPHVNDTVKYLNVLADRVNERAKGELTIEIIGGPEAIPRKNQAEAIRSGVVDVNALNTGSYEAMVPSIWAWVLTEINIVEERERGFYEFMQPKHAEAGLYMLGSTITNNERIVALTKKVSGRKDLKGIKVRAVETYYSYLEELGFTPVFMPLGDVYTAMERGTVDGLHATTSSIVDTCLYEVSDYWIAHPLTGSRVAVLINQNSWEKLPSHLQDLVKSTWIELEPECVDYFTDSVKQQKKVMMDNGMEPITFSAEDAKWVLDVYRNPRWEEVKEKVSPEDYQKLQKLLKK